MSCCSTRTPISRAEPGEGEIEWLSAIPLTDAFGITGPVDLLCLPLGNWKVEDVQRATMKASATRCESIGTTKPRTVPRMAEDDHPVLLRRTAGAGESCKDIRGSCRFDASQPTGTAIDPLGTA